MRTHDRFHSVPAIIDVVSHLAAEIDNDNKPFLHLYQTFFRRGRLKSSAIVHLNHIGVWWFCSLRVIHPCVRSLRFGSHFGTNALRPSDVISRSHDHHHQQQSLSLKSTTRFIRSSSVFLNLIDLVTCIIAGTLPVRQSFVHSNAITSAVIGLTIVLVS